MTDAPNRVWLRPRLVRDPDEPVLPGQGWYQTLLVEGPDTVEYVRKDLVEGLVKSMAEAMENLAAMYRDDL